MTKTMKCGQDQLICRSSGNCGGEGWKVGEGEATESMGSPPSGSGAGVTGAAGEGASLFGAGAGGEEGESSKGFMIWCASPKQANRTLMRLPPAAREVRGDP